LTKTLNLVNYFCGIQNNNIIFWCTVHFFILTRFCCCFSLHLEKFLKSYLNKVSTRNDFLSENERAYNMSVLRERVRAIPRFWASHFLFKLEPRTCQKRKKSTTNRPVRRISLRGDLKYFIEYNVFYNL